MNSRFVRAIFCLVALQLAIANLSARGPWVALQNCRLLVKRANDGDSFHVSVSGREYIFRLYFVDAPETDTEFRERVEEQAKYFGMTTDQNTTLGLLAKTYTREKLSGPFEVRTCWEDAMGRSRLQRFYALVQTNNGDLGEQLVENGLARIHGIQASPQGITSARQEWQKLETLERKAKREHVGGWGASEGRMSVRSQDLESDKGVDPFDAFFHSEKAAQNGAGPLSSPAASPAPSSTTVPAVQSARGANNITDETKLDVNSASQAELENLPGIGPVLAERIMAARPFKTADDLRKVKGIGDKKYEKLRPFFH